MLKIVLIFSVIAVIVIILPIIVFNYKMRNFKPNSNKSKQLENINNDLKYAGFAYSPRGDYFYSLKNCWQRNAGYCKFYDDNSIFLNIVIHCEPITFSYGGKKWLIEFWKGQYGITTGGEVGIYNTIKKDIKTDEFSGTFYEKIKANELLSISFILKRDNKIILKRKDIHWWLTGFKLGKYSKRSQLSMKIKIKFPNNTMRDAFIKGLEKVGYSQKEYSVFKNTVKISYTTPHTPQPFSQRGLQSAIVQQTNHNNCKIFNVSTQKYKNTLDKLEYIKAGIPVLYDMFIGSIYGKKFYDQIKDLKFIKDVYLNPFHEKQLKNFEENHLGRCICQSKQLNYINQNNYVENSINYKCCKIKDKKE